MRRPRRIVAVVFGALLLVVLVTPPTSSPGATGTAIPGAPLVPAGWNSWNAFGCDVDQAEIESAADAMVADGMRAAGYRYVVLDDCWVAAQRDSAGRLTADRVRFPDGIAALARYVHARGLLFGIYTSASTKTCAQRSGEWPGATGSAGHEAEDAATFASWGVDLVKDDWCAGTTTPGRQRAAFAAFRDGIRASGRPMVFSINPNSGVDSGVPGVDDDWAGIATTVRISHDVIPIWSNGGAVDASQGIEQAIATAERVVRSDWNRRVRQDADMLVTGDSPSLTVAEQRSQLAILAVLGLPLMAGTDLTRMSPETRSLLVAPRLLRLDQDALAGPQRLGDRDGVHIWIRETGSGLAVAAYNPTDSARSVSLGALISPGARDVWSGKAVGGRAIMIGPHDSTLVLTPTGSTPGGVLERYRRSA